ncbi:MAG: YdeI/OmpD-associated family protein [Chitinophagaceae bacterium]
MVKFIATIHRFEKMGEKTGWTYIEVPADIAEKLKPGNRREFKVKGKLDAHPVKRASLMPMKGGGFIMPVNAAMRKGIGKRHGAMVKVQLEADDSPFVFNRDFIDCLNDEPKAKEFFQTLSGSHQRYFSKWIDEAKTEPTRTKRIALSVNALSKKWGYPEMIRSNQKKNIGE